MFGGTATEARPKFGLIVDNPKHQEGVAETGELAELVKTCGCKAEDGSLLQVRGLPFQGNARKDGQKWQLRIEPSAANETPAGMVQGHRWVFAMAAGSDDQNR